MQLCLVRLNKMSIQNLRQPCSRLGLNCSLSEWNTCGGRIREPLERQVRCRTKPRFEQNETFVAWIQDAYVCTGSHVGVKVARTLRRCKCVMRNAHLHQSQKGTRCAEIRVSHQRQSSVAADALTARRRLKTGLPRLHSINCIPHPPMQQKYIREKSVANKITFFPDARL